VRLRNIFLVICLVIIITLSAVFYSRSSVVTAVVNNYLTEHNSALTCLDFDINKDFDVVIKGLCIDSPYAEIALLDSLIIWRLDSKNITANSLLTAISAINIAEVKVRSKTDFKFPTRTIPVLVSENNPVELKGLPTFIRAKLDELALLVTPVAIDIKRFSYQPFLAGKGQEIDAYHGQLTIDSTQLSFSLTDQVQEEILSIELVKKDQGLSANVATDLAKLRAFSIQHKSVFPANLSTLLLDQAWSARGKINSQLNWHKQTLSMVNQVTDFSFASSSYTSSLGAVKLATNFTFQANLTNETLDIDFTNEYENGPLKKQEDIQDSNSKSNSSSSQSNNIQLTFSSATLLQSLSGQAIDPQLITLFADNAINTLTVKPLGSLSVDFTKKTITSDGVDLISGHLNEPIKLSVNDLAFSYADDLALAVNLQHAIFSLAGQVNVGQLQPYSKKPVKLNIIGDIEQHSDSWQVTLNQGTAIELAQLSLPMATQKTIMTSQPQVAKVKQQPSIKSLLSYWQGKVVIVKNKQQISNQDITLALTINNQINQLNYPDIMKIKVIELTATLNGRVDNMTVNSKMIADNVPIASAKLSGDLRQPSISISAQKLLLTDILALNIKLPIKLKPIDGTINYHLTGQLNNSKNSKGLMANPMSLALSVQDFSGDVAGTWLQDVNWQQNFILQNGQIKSIADNSKTLPNLTIAKIEAATVIHNVATTTAIDFSPDNLKLRAENTRGNLLGGRFDINQVQWPFTKLLPLTLKLTTIDLEKLLELDKKQGIVVTGKISGNLPIYYDGEHLLIKEGYLHNVGDGLIQVYNNPAVEELKANGTQLKLAFDALENLHYHHLSSEVSMADDGYMLLVTAIKGRNPDLDNDVNLNLNLSYDLIGLLESLNITEHFENKLLKGSKN